LNSFCSQSGVPPELQILAGPILRKCHRHEVNIWLVSQEALRWRCLFFSETDAEKPFVSYEHSDIQAEQFQVGERCYIFNLTFSLAAGFQEDTLIFYDLQFQQSEASQWVNMKQWAADSLLYTGFSRPFFVIKSRLNRVFHGSCRKPHHPAADGLVRADRYCQDVISKESQIADQFPGLLVMSGDQVYVDDVAGPMMIALHGLIDALGMPTETFTHMPFNDSAEIYHQVSLLYHRDQLLPDTTQLTSAYDAIFGGAKKPVFTSVHAKNHLISLAEMIAMYLLVWSPVGWQFTSMQAPDQLDEQQRSIYLTEQQRLHEFIEHLSCVRRLMAHLPVAMIFDDHDITDDWNLTASWEQAAYGNPFSRRIIGNALIAYLLCQGLSNAPDQFPVSLRETVKKTLLEPGSQHHDDLIDQLLQFSNWDYQWPTSPALLVLDTRTQRWRSVRAPGQPSGLLDWEALMRLHEQLMHKDSVLLIAPAPIFGVKLIEAIQRVMTWLGYPLMVDAENWMAHSGTASTLLNMFCHAQTPRNFLILSGDVHYSFVYHVKMRGLKSSPDIWQITSSGFKNTFPILLLDILDRLNRWLYSPKSPLNWFTKRRDMVVSPYRPSDASRGERLVKCSGVGLIELDEDNRPEKIWQLSDDQTDVQFFIEKSS